MAPSQIFVYNILIFLVFFIFEIYAESIHRSFQYKYSFKGPYLAQKDGTVPFWEYDGSTIASEEMVRITPSLKSKKGSIWAKNKTTFNWWEVELVFRITGRGRLGADGLAFWYTDRKGVEGPVFGNNDNWSGLGIFFDSFDNDGKSNNPYIMAMVNDGSKSYDHVSDGMNQQLAGCQRDFRNKPFPVRAKIEYYKNVLTVMINHGLTANDQDFEVCLRAENVFLPQYGVFGVSAATGALADDHDVYKLLTSALYPPGSEPFQAATHIAESEKEKFSREYEQYKEKLERQKEEYRKLNPELAREREDNPEEGYETQQQQELKQIFQGQAHIFEIIKGLSRKVDEIIGRQERLMSMVSAVQVPHPSGGGPAGGAGGYQVPSDSIRRHEVEAVLGNQKELIQNIRDLRAFIPEIHQRIQTLSANGAADAEMKEALGNLRRDMSAVLAQSAKPCPQPLPPPPSNCLSPIFFLTFMGIQLVVVAGYLIYRSSKETQAKKFY